jgi:dCMP deaminase
MIIGITGTIASGKDTLASLLIKSGFNHLSLSDEIRIEITKRKLSPDRGLLTTVGNELRERFGSGILAERVCNRLREDKNYVITSIRNPEEVNVLAKIKDFILIHVSADPKLRYERLRSRNRHGDVQSFEQFLQQEKAELSADHHKQQLHLVARMARIIVNNDGSLEELEEKTDHLLADLKKRFHHSRPSWDEYFVKISRVVAERGTCDRGKSGSVIVRDKKILCTGYVGSAAGLPHCDELGHQMKTLVHEDGHQSRHCVRTIHAEQNAICQAAKEGISLKGSTLYCKMEPCSVCAKMIINCGIRRVVCEKRYHAAEETRQLFASAKVKMDILDDSTERYRDQ